MKFTRRNLFPVIAGAGAAFTGAAGLVPGLALKDVNAADLSTLMEPGPLGEHIVGDPNAPITIIEYASMTCPHCKRWHEDVYPAIKEKYINQLWFLMIWVNASNAMIKFTCLMLS